MNENPEGLPKEFVEPVLKEITPEFLSIYPEPDRFLNKYAEFVGEVFSCPGFSKEFLSIIYGDYMRLPPEDKRSVGHSIVEFDFGGTDTEN